MQTVEEFLAYSIHLESEAAARFGELADAMQSAGNREVAGLFRRLSDYSKLHLADARARAGFRKNSRHRAAGFGLAGSGKPGSGRDLGRRSDDWPWRGVADRAGGGNRRP